MKVITESSRYIFSDFFKIEEAFIRRETFSGQMSPPIRQLNFERGDSTACLLYNTDRNAVILTKQFRYPAHTKGSSWIIEAIAGSLKPGEDPAEGIQRELLEEVGYQAAKLTFLYTFFVSPGGTSERIHLFYAEVSNADHVAQGGGLEQEHEDIQTLYLSPAQLKEAMEKGELADAKTLIAAQWFLQNKA